MRRQKLRLIVKPTRADMAVRLAGVLDELMDVRLPPEARDLVREAYNIATGMSEVD